MTSTKSSLDSDGYQIVAYRVRPLHVSLSGSRLRLRHVRSPCDSLYNPHPAGNISPLLNMNGISFGAIALTGGRYWFVAICPSLESLHDTGLANLIFLFVKR